MNKITAIIPVRAGSTRLKNKNIASFAGTNLLVNKRTGCDIDDGLDLACARAWLDMDETVSQIDPYVINDIKKPLGRGICSIRQQPERRAA